MLPNIVQQFIICLGKKCFPVTHNLEKRRHFDKPIILSRQMCLCTAPWPRSCNRCKIGTHWIHFDIKSSGEKIIFIHRERSKAPLPEMPSPILAEVDHTTVAPVSFTDSPTQTILGFRSSYEVDMIRHKTVSPNFHVALLAPFGHQGNVRLIVFILKERRQPSIAPLSNMVGNTGSYNTSDSSHARKLTLSTSGVNVELSKVSPDQPPRVFREQLLTLAPVCS